MSNTSQTEQIDNVMAQRAMRKSRRNWRFIAFVALGIAVIAILGRALGGFSEPIKAAHVARVVIDGTIASDPVRRTILNDLADDETVSAVIVQINSPGGTTAGGEELYEGLSRIRANKPVVSVINELGASAAYMTAVGSDRIIARRLSIVGSIGVLVMHLDASKLFQTIGLDYDKVSTGPLKAEPDIDEPMADDVRAAYQSLVDDSYDWFVDIVADRRQLERHDVLRLADGRVLTGRQALKEQLIDAIGDETSALDWLKENHDIDDQDVSTYFPLPESEWQKAVDLLGSTAKNFVGSSLKSVTKLDGLVSVWQPTK
ncbi:signal peptide peptidase SppA [Maritalea porphyrae]|uniref:signal peptide peptidase SppA n=1 Tax=Maritalea porphyrae TaxID=880732 RepID=UPI0022AE9DE6|nr:signal peptide peptidase SppA [Maritalea porphyrae]MCZ4271990.1 signal peptide peptidase SppA [Maritalea porphyrae]